MAPREMLARVEQVERFPRPVSATEHPVARAEQACRALAEAIALRPGADDPSPDDATLAGVLMGLAETFAAAARSLRGPRAVAAEKGLALVRPGSDGAASPLPERCCFRRDGEYWTVVYEGKVSRLRDTRGLRHLATLLHHASREFHCTELVVLVEGAETPAPSALAEARQELRVARADRGGPVLDARARAEYHARLADLRDELEEATHLSDLGRVARARGELEHLGRQLEDAARSQPWRSTAERARLTVTKALGAALARIDEADPSLGRHLRATIRRGYFCAYVPDPRRAIAWDG
jgi:non-specific serine/threonine protein kinase